MPPGSQPGPLASAQTTAPATTGTATTPSQAPAGDRVATVIAVVGDSVITNAFVIDALNTRVQQMRADSVPLPRDSAAVRALQDTLINERIDELVILQTIARDTTMKLNEENLRTAVEDQYNKVQQSVGGPVPFAQALRQSGMTAQEYRNTLTIQIRTRELFNMFRQRMTEKRQAPKASEKEIEARFPAWQAARGPRPATVNFQQIVIPIQPSDTALARAKAKADSIFQVVVKNKDAFAELARKFSDDPGSREKGGEFGWFNEGEVFKEFGRAAFSAPVGTITPPVRTQAGYHVIDVQRHQGAQVQARHILISPTITAEDIARARARADSAAAKLRAGADIQSVIKQYGDAAEDLTVAGADPKLVMQRTGLDLSASSKGDIVGPGAPTAGPVTQFTIARITDTSPAGPWSLNDVGVRDNIRSIIESQKLIDEIVSELKRDTYIEIRAH
jgi:parvulin-like peptidyl-prolyl isomerase